MQIETTGEFMRRIKTLSDADLLKLARLIGDDSVYCLFEKLLTEGEFIMRQNAVETEVNRRFPVEVLRKVN